MHGYGHDADTDSHSDTDFDGAEDDEKPLEPIEGTDKIKIEKKNLELLEKSLGRYEGNAYDMTEWQIMVHVIQGRDFAGLDLNPYVSVQIDDQRRYTTVHKSSNSPYYGEVIDCLFTVDKELFLLID